MYINHLLTDHFQTLPMHDDQELYVYDAGLRRKIAEKEVAQYAQRLAWEQDGVQRRIDATRRHYWCILADTYAEWMQSDNCTHARNHRV